MRLLRLQRLFQCVYGRRFTNKSCFVTRYENSVLPYSTLTVRSEVRLKGADLVVFTNPGELLGSMFACPPVRLAYDSIDSNSDGEDLPPLVILHGLFGSKTNWRTLARHFHKQTGRKIITVDARNHGESQHSPQMNYFLQALDICHLFQELELTKAVVMGHSMGGKTAMTFALSHPESVDSLIVVDMSPTKLDLDEDILKYLATKRAMNLNLIKDKRDAEKMLMDVVPNSFLRSFFLTNLVKSETGFRWRINLEALENNLPEVSSFPTDFPHQHFDGKALFVGGARSDYVRVEDYPAIHKLFPRAGVKFIPDSGHWPHAEKPQEFLEMVTAFLDECLQDHESPDEEET